MTYLQALILAIVEGLTEFLPISSTAHILLAEKFLQVSNRELFASFTIFIQLGAMLAVLFLFLKQLWQSKDIWWKIILAFIPTGLLGVLFFPLVKNYLQDASPLTGWMLIGGGIIFTFLDWFWRQKAEKNPAANAKITATSSDSYLPAVKKAPWWKMTLIGTGQAAAMVPGVSRSAATIFSARALGFSQFAATQFSFVLALPTIAAASGFDLLQAFLDRHEQVACSCVSAPCVCPTVYNVFNSQGDLLLMLFGALVAFLVALATANFFIKILGKKPFFWWGIYRVMIGLVWLTLF